VDGGSNGAIFDSNKFKMAAAAAAILDNFEWPYLRNGLRSTYIARIATDGRTFVIRAVGLYIFTISIRLAKLRKRLRFRPPNMLAQNTK